ncbi:MAG: aminotransferase class III-fold pyridoxal phosphate-dependent enzyme, partial [Acidimicrobiia bacterium]|nr:aminotransferase class III-fold pyridoxal phosphate-dependent enzyme [Acidimicrobiia bacterium]
VVAGGTPAAAYGGRADLMRLVAPDGPVYQAGTLAGNPLAVAAGLATLRHLRDHPEAYEELEEMGGRLEERLSEALSSHSVPGCVQRVGAMLTVFFGPDRVGSWTDAADVDRGRFSRFFHASLDGGVMLPPSPYEALFLMVDHGPVLDEAADVLVEAIGAAA